MKLGIINLCSKNVAAIGLVVALAVTVSGCGAKRTTIIVRGETKVGTADQSQAKNKGQIVASDRHFKQGLKFYQANKYKQAIKSFRKSIEKNPQNWESHYYLGLSLHDTKEFVMARKRFDIAVKHAPKDNHIQARIFIAVALSLESVGKTHEAGNYFSLALKYQPKNKKARSGLDRMRTGKNPGKKNGKGKGGSKRG
ncbi:MAG: tetratricopeptide repeat protein [candidate division Zixibacteria bacterium]|nr:tetratricopeptide repeat protein [candidate division Zixibacteria bacterium]